MVKGIVAAVALVAGIAAGGEKFAWPADVSYKGKPRTAEWLEKAFAYYSDRLQKVDGEWVDVKQIQDRGGRIGTSAHLAGKVKDVVGDEELVLSIMWGTRGFGPPAFAYWHIKGVPTKRMLTGVDWEGDVAIVGTFEWDGKRIHSCRPLPAAKEPLTEAQFVDILRADVPLGKWAKRAPPKKGEIRLDKNTMEWVVVE